MPAPPRVHPTACVHENAELAEDVIVWQFAQVREGARVGAETRIGMGAYVDAGVIIGKRCKLQNHVCTFAGLVVEDGVFLGPAAVFTNDLHPRAVNPDGSIKGETDWIKTPTRVETGASIGANATIACGIVLGAHSMVGAGSVVTRSVPAHGLVRGNPARLVGFVGKSGYVLHRVLDPLRRPGDETNVLLRCERTGEEVRVPLGDWSLQNGPCA